MTPEALSSTAPAESQADRPDRNGPPATSSTTVVIEAGKSHVSLGLKDFWAYRELLYFLTWRDVKVRYKQTLLGAAWAILQPLLTMLIFTLLFGRLAGIKTDGPYPIFAYGGLLIWTFFANAVTNSGNSLVGSSSLITKIYFPRMIIPAAAVAASVVDLVLAFLVQIVLMAYYRVHLSWAITMVPVLVALSTLLALGVGMWLSALNVKYRDIRYAIPFLIQLWMFASAVIYPLNMLPPKWQTILMFNPVTGIVENFRVALLSQQAFEWKILGISVVETLVILIYSAFSFRRMEKQFADIV